MMSTDIEKKSPVSEEGHVLTAYVFLSGRKLGQYADQEFLYPFSKINLRT